jgi:hypothetical protein
MGFMVILATTIVNVEEVLVDRVAVGPADPDESERQSMLNEYSGSQRMGRRSLTARRQLVPT